ncbi:MAG: YbaB/EbfC family nucleoid-associated protein [Candidatus Omnitrophota bacterium]
MFDNLKKMMDLQKKLEVIKKELSSMKIEHTKSGFSVIITGEQIIEKINLVDNFSSLKKEELEKIIKDLINEAIAKSQKTAADKMKNMAGLNIPGL